MANKKLIAARERKFWTQVELAEKVGVTFVTISRWENGVQQPRAYALKKLCQVFDALPEDLGLDKEVGSSDELNSFPGILVPGSSNNEAFEAPNEELEFDAQEFMKLGQYYQQQMVRLDLSHDEFVVLSELIRAGGNMALVDLAKRKTLEKLLKLSTGFGAFLVLANTETQASPIEIRSSKVGENSLDLDVIGGYTEALQELLAKGEAQYVMRASQDLYHKLLREHPHSRDIRLGEAQFRLGMLVGAAQEYALPWYQRDQAVLQTYNYLEDNLVGKFEMSSSLQHEYVRLLAKRGRQYRVLWQFEDCVKECENGLSSLREPGDFSLRTHFLCERAHIEATRGDELAWMCKLEEARRGALDMNLVEREQALNQVDYMQGEGYKRFAFHTQKDLPMSVRERYAKFALNQFTQWKGATIELPGFESLVAQVSRVQCLLLVDPDEAIHLSGQLRKRAEQRYPALLDKIHRVVFLAQQRLQISSSEFLQIFNEASQSPYHLGKNIL